MRDSATLCLRDAESQLAKGNTSVAGERAVKSLLYSVGVLLENLVALVVAEAT